MTRTLLSLVGAAAVAVALSAAAPAAAQQTTSPLNATPQLGGELPLVVAHRGASGYRPEHTLASYALGIDMGADFVEPDLVMTRDGVLVARHEPHIGTTTDVADKFADRKRKKTLDGTEIEEFWVEDFTLAELKTLRARQPFAERANAWNDRLEVPTLQEVIDLVRRKNAETGRTIGIYPETKHPTFFAQQGLDMNAALLQVLGRNGYTERSSPVFVQSFEVANLKALSQRTRVRLIQLFDEYDVKPYDFVVSGDPRTYRDLMKPENLREIATYAYGIGPWKRTIVEEDEAGNLRPANTLVADAHAANLRVHPYTFRDEPRRLANDYAGDPVLEYIHFYRLGVDGVFTDHPDTALRARRLVYGR